LSLNYNKTQYAHFRTNNSLIPQVDISYKNRYIVNDTITRFLGIPNDSSLSWKNHIDELTVKLSKALNEYNNPSFATMFERALLNTYITTCFGLNPSHHQVL
jgi:hypothetical protein